MAVVLILVSATIGGFTRNAFRIEFVGTRLTRRAFARAGQTGSQGGIGIGLFHTKDAKVAKPETFSFGVLRGLRATHKNVSNPALAGEGL